MNEDLRARLNQSVCDKLLDSTTYPLVVSEKSESFPGCDRMILKDEALGYLYTDNEMRDLLIRCVSEAGQSTFAEQISVSDQLYSFCGEIIEQYRKALDASGDPDYEGPDRRELQRVVDGGIENLIETLGDWDAYAWCSYIRVNIEKRPSIGLASPRIEFSGFQVNAKATGELWIKYPWPNCYKGCTKWKKILKCKKAASITVSVTVKVDAHADITTSSNVVLAKLAFDKLRLPYGILEKIPLERIANRGLRNKNFPIYDASKLVQTVPPLGSTFGISQISLPQDPTGITIVVEVSEVP